MPITPGTPSAIAASTAAIASRITSMSSLINVGRKPVVPKRRCASPMRRIVSTVGASLNSTPPPPLTWQSMKPGSSRSPPRSSTVEIGYAAIVRGDDRVDHAGVDEHGDVVAETIRGQHARVDERGGHQTVSVTLLRCGGASGSRPRRTASAFTAS